MAYRAAVSSGSLPHCVDFHESVLLLPIIKLLIIFVVIIVDYYLLVVKVLDNAVSAARICKIEDNNQ